MIRVRNTNLTFTQKVRAVSYGVKMARVRKLGGFTHTYTYIVMFIHTYTHHVGNISILYIVNRWVCNKTPNFLTFYKLSGVDTSLTFTQKVRSPNLT